MSKKFEQRMHKRWSKQLEQSKREQLLSIPISAAELDRSYIILQELFSGGSETATTAPVNNDFNPAAPTASPTDKQEEPDRQHSISSAQTWNKFVTTIKES